MEPTDIETSSDAMPVVPELEAAKQQLPAGDALADLPAPALTIHLAMVHSGGDYQKAADALGVTKTKLREMMRPFPQLRTRWGRLRPGGYIKQTHAFQGEQTLTEEQAQALMEQKHKEGLLLMGLREKSATLAINMQNYHARHQAHSMGILSGGLVRAALETMEMVERLKANPYDDETSLDGVLVKSGAKATDEMILRALDAYGRKVLEYGNSEVLRRKLAADSGGGKGGKSKPKFGAAPMRTQVLAQPGSNVNFIASNHPQNESTETKEDTHG
jgi:hypothetical protein